MLAPQPTTVGSLVLEVVGPAAQAMSEPRKVMTGEVLRLGRRPDNDWVFPQEYVSRTQLIVRHLGTLHLLEQVGTCPVALNDPGRPLRLHEIVAVAPGQRLFIDDIEIRLSHPEHPDSGERAQDRRYHLDPQWFADELEQKSGPAPFNEPGDALSGTLADFLDGAGAGANIQPTAAVARELGAMFRVCLDGLVLMLRARNQLRAELHVERTHVHLSDNPLKTAPDSVAAWDALLARLDNVNGSALSAVKEAFADVRYHELALLSGQRAAFDHILETFHPDALQDELREDHHSVIGGLWAALNRDHLWKRYVRRYGQLLSDPHDAYRELFREPIAHAYEESLRELKQVGAMRHGLELES